MPLESISKTLMHFADFKCLSTKKETRKSSLSFLLRSTCSLSRLSCPFFGLPPQRVAHWLWGLGVAGEGENQRQSAGPATQSA